ncbi:MAG: D-sedoheptulose 7-phosphate isomerase [Candidatus Cloacimonetes bacterium]|nr:D-sedoheptulose 7-phosphate isomerase [Candidatus Cloacimonadota bacterium]MBL7148653.1 D-sedoheptulose 7-phosphate isomerase [Candidatus Cloacimonadota bacterium]
MIENIKRSFQNAAKLFAQFAADQNIINATEKVGIIIAECFRKGNKLLIFGNGGSSTDAMHFAEELTGKFRKDRKPLPALSLTDPSHITCVANDYGFEEVFARGVEAYGKTGDIAIGISTSGNSENVIRALHRAKKLGMGTVALLGLDGGKLKGFCDHEIIVPGKTTDRIQELHITVLHVIIETIERVLFPQNYQDSK